MKKLFTFLSMLSITVAAYAQNYAAIAGESRVFDKPNVKSYATTNTSGQEIILMPGMVFSVSPAQSGWNKIEYTPGINAFVMNSQLTQQSQISAPKTGEYTVANDAGKRIVISENGGNWSAKVNGQEYKGLCVNNLIVFVDKFSNPAYSLAVVSGKTYVYSYDNKLTKFF